MKKISLKEIENAYSKAILQRLGEGEYLTAETLADWAVQLYCEFQVKEVPTSGELLLFQYGTEKRSATAGEHFRLAVVRQLAVQHQTFRLEFSLLYAPAPFINEAPYVCDNADFGGTDNWLVHLKTTEGYRIAQTVHPQSYRLSFREVK